MTNTPPVGTKIADGSVFAGLTADGKQQIYVWKTDLTATLFFNDAARAVSTLNTIKSLGHDDWQIPSVESLRVLQKNQNEGALKGTFKTASSSGPGIPHWYWSSTESTPGCGRDGRPGPSRAMDFVCFSDGHEDWHPKNYIPLSCRPVRLVAAPASAPCI